MAKDVSLGLDYRALGLLCGIEIHQQLDTACKLFCGCPNEFGDEPNRSGEKILEAIQAAWITEV